MDLIDVFGIEFNNNSEKVDQISFLKLGRRKIRVKNCGFPPLDGIFKIIHIFFDSFFPPYFMFAVNKPLNILLLYLTCTIW